MVEKPKYRHKRYLKNYLLNRRLQLRYALWVTFISAAIATALGLIIYQQSAFASDQILAGLDAAGVDWLDPQTKEQIRVQLERSDLGLVTTMIAIGLTLAIGLMALLIVMTHKVAGPLHRMVQTFVEIRQGRLPAAGSLRKGDQFQELFDTLAATQTALRDRAREETEIIQKLFDACERAAGARSPELAAALDELRVAQQEKQASLQ